MLTVVALLLLPGVLCMSIFRVWVLPRTVLSGGLKLNPRWPIAAAVGLASMYFALAAYTALVLFTIGRTLWNPPSALQELVSVAAVAVAYPFVLLLFEWVLFHSIQRNTRK